MGRLQDNQYAPTFQKKKQDNAQLKEERDRKEAKLQVLTQKNLKIKKTCNSY